MKNRLTNSTFWRTENQTSSYERLMGVLEQDYKGKGLYVSICNRSEGFIETDSKNMISQKGVFC